MIRNIFRGTRGPANPKYLIVGEFFGTLEARFNKPFIGSSGKELSKILFEAGIPENQCLFTNLINRQPVGNNMKRFFYTTKEAKAKGMFATRGLYPKPQLEDALLDLEELITKTKPEYIIGLGNYALWGLTENFFSIGNSDGYKVPLGINKRRGSQIYDRVIGAKLLPTIHPAAACRQWPLRYHMKFDLQIRLNKEWTPPKNKFHVAPKFNDTLPKSTLPLWTISPFLITNSLAIF